MIYPTLLGLIVLAGILWRMGGSDNYDRIWRGIGVPTVLALMARFLASPHFSYIAFLATIGIGYMVLTISYGVTSPLGIFYSWFIKDLKVRDILIRGTCGFCWSGVYIPLIFYKGNYWSLLACLVPTTLVPLVRISGVDRINGWIEEFLMGVVYALGMALVIIL